MGPEDTPGGEQGADFGARRGVVADPFRQDVPGAGQGLVGRLNVLLRIDEGEGGLGGVETGFRFPEQVGERFKAAFAGDHGPGAAFRAERLVDVLQG